MQKNLENLKDMVCYGLFDLKHEPLPIDEDDLCIIRERFFERKKKIKDKFTVMRGGYLYKCTVLVQNSRPMKLKKTIDDHLIEYSELCKDNKYKIIRNNKDKTINRIVYFDNNHNWLKTEYFSPSQVNIPIEEIYAADDKIILEKYDSCANKNTIYNLLPINIPENENERLILDKAIFSPKIICKTNSGQFYLCTEEELSAGNEALLNHKTEGDVSINEFCDEYTAVNGFSIDASLLESDIPASFSVDQPSISDLTYSSTEESDEQEITCAELLKLLDECIKECSVEAEILEPDILGSDSSHVPKQDKNSHSFTDSRKNDHASLDMEEDKLSRLKKYNVAISQIFKNSASSISNDSQKSKEKPWNFNNNKKSDEVVFSRIPDTHYDVKTTFCGKNACPYIKESENLININGDFSHEFYKTMDDFKDLQNNKTRFNKDGDIGFGVHFYKGSNVCFAGNLKDHKRNGFGVLYNFKDLTVSVGNWENDVPIGMNSVFDQKGNLVSTVKTDDNNRQGAYISYDRENGNILIQQWENNSKTGRVTEFNSKGTPVYIGQWSNNNRNGYGVLYLENGNIICGNFINGDISGSASEISQGGKIIYEGHFKNGLYNGYGCRYCDNGNYYKGLFIDGKVFGNVCIYNKNGELIYEGAIENFDNTADLDAFSAASCK